MDLLTFLHQKGFARFSRSTLWSTILALQCEDLLSRSFFMYISNPFLWSFKNRVNQCCRRLFLFLSFFLLCAILVCEKWVAKSLKKLLYLQISPIDYQKKDEDFTCTQNSKILAWLIKAMTATQIYLPTRF